MNLDSVYDFVLAGLGLVLAVAILLGLIRIYTSRAAAERAVVGDLVYFSGVGILMIVGIQSGSAVVQDAAMLAAFVGILATVALARILTRGER